MLRVRVRRLLVSASLRHFATMPPALPALAEVKAWDTSRVVAHAKSIGLDDDDVKILSSNKINGEDLLTLTEDKLLRVNMPLGPASRLAAAITKMRDTRE